MVALQEETLVDNKGDSLEAFLIGTLSESLGVVSVSNLVRLTGGANRETWSFDAVDTERNASELIVQVDREGLDRLIGTCAKEAQIVTKAVASSDTPNALGRSFTITRRIDGETIARKILRDQQWETARSKLVTDCAKALAAIHSIPLEELDGIELVKDIDSLASLVEIYDALSDPHPTFDLAIRWLEANRPEPLGPCLVHGDFRLGNLLVGEDGLRAVLDWEIAHIGDPAADLGWMCVRAWRFGGKGKVAGIGRYRNFLKSCPKFVGGIYCRCIGTN